MPVPPPQRLRRHSPRWVRRRLLGWWTLWWRWTLRRWCGPTAAPMPLQKPREQRRSAVDTVAVGAMSPPSYLHVSAVVGHPNAEPLAPKYDELEKGQMQV